MGKTSINSSTRPVYRIASLDRAEAAFLNTFSIDEAKPK